MRESASDWQRLREARLNDASRVRVKTERTILSKQVHYNVKYLIHRGALGSWEQNMMIGWRQRSVCVTGF